MSDAATDEKPKTDQRLSETDRLVCAACGETVTRERFAVTRRDAHAHTVFNPMGQVFEIRCFSHAACVNAEPARTEFTWFPGYAWRLAHCAGCGVQLGWHYEGDGVPFYGLIRGRLRRGG